MASMRTNRRVYSAEELHRLRGTTSQPKLREAIEAHDGDDAELVKEHVLRGSKSFAARSWKSRASGNSLRVPSNKENRSTSASDNDRPVAPQPTKLAPVLGEIAPNNQVLRPAGGPFKPRPSPTPSLRKKKIESLVKAHGSPTHVRVTAGGRIVPSEQSPLCHPRYGYSAIKTNGGLIKFAPNHPVGKAQPLQWTQATQNGFVAQDVNGRLCQIVDGVIMPLHETANGLQLYMPAPNLDITGGTPAQGGPPNVPPPPQRNSTRIVSAEPSIASQINALELEYSKLENESKDIDKTEVLHGRTMGKGAKDALVARRRELVVAKDNVRKALKSIREQAPATSPSHAPPAMNKPSVSPPARNRLPPFLQQRQNQPMTLPPAPAAFSPFYQPPPFGGVFGFPPMPSPEFGMPPAAMFVPPPPFDGSMSSTSLPYQPPFSSRLAAELQVPAVGTTENASDGVPELPQHDGARSFADLQRVTSPLSSHALPIKAPLSAGKSTLNPMSPIYKPGTGLVSPGPAQTHETPARSSTNKKKSFAPLRSSSTSSFVTADFFPHDTKAYSTRQYAHQPNATEDPTEDKENVEPVTPKPPAAPPASPVDLPDRDKHNLSPKNRILGSEVLSITSTDPEKALPPGPLAPASAPTASPDVDSAIELPAEVDDFAGKSHDFIAGYHAALSQSQQRITSLSSMDSRRVFSPLEWKSMSSVAAFAGLARGETTTTSVSSAVEKTTPPTGVAAKSVSFNNSSSPDKAAKGASPARQKFEHIAEMVGIKVAGSPKQRRWRDVWRGAGAAPSTKD